MRKTLIVASLLLAACAAPANRPVIHYPLTNDEGHVIGHKQVVSDLSSGSQVEEVTLYTPRYGEAGELIGYEEPVPNGAVLRALDGRRIGVRQVDMRSRATNQANPGITTLFVGH
jgi:hypothetical protein